MCIAPRIAGIARARANRPRTCAQYCRSAFAETSASHFASSLNSLGWMICETTTRAGAAIMQTPATVFRKPRGSESFAIASSSFGLCRNGDSLLLEQGADLLDGDVGVDDRADLRLRVVEEGMFLIDAAQRLEVGNVDEAEATLVGEPTVLLEVFAVAVVPLALGREQTRELLERRLVLRGRNDEEAHCFTSDGTTNANTMRFGRRLRLRAGTELRRSPVLNFSRDRSRARTPLRQPVPCVRKRRSSNRCSPRATPPCARSARALPRCRRSSVPARAVEARRARALSAPRTFVSIPRAWVGRPRARPALRSPSRRLALLPPRDRACGERSRARAGPRPPRRERHSCGTDPRQ